MPCPAGQHRHYGSKGKEGGMGSCHDVNTKHRDATTQMWHDRALQSVSEETQTTDIQSQYDKYFGKTKANKNSLEGFLNSAIKEVTRRVRSTNKKDFGNLFIWAIPFLWGFKSIALVYDKIKQNAQMNKLDNIQVGYAKGYTEIDSEVDMTDIAKWQPEDYDKVIDKISNKYKEICSNPQSEKEGTIEYGERKAYRDFLVNLQASMLAQVEIWEDEKAGNKTKRPKLNSKSKSLQRTRKIRNDPNKVNNILSQLEKKGYSMKTMRNSLETKK